MLRELEETAMRERGEMPPPPPPGAGAEAGPSGAGGRASKEGGQKKQRIKWMPPGVEPVLEEQPKWLVLSEVLEEIEQQMMTADVHPCALSLFASSASLLWVADALCHSQTAQTTRSS